MAPSAIFARPAQVAPPAPAMPDPEEVFLPGPVDHCLQRHRHVELAEPFEVRVSVSCLASTVTPQLQNPTVETIFGQVSGQPGADLGVGEGPVSQQDRNVMPDVVRDPEE